MPLSEGVIEPKGRDQKVSRWMFARIYGSYAIVYEVPRNTQQVIMAYS